MFSGDEIEVLRLELENETKNRWEILALTWGNQ
jgi:hypothetical protein